MVLLAFLIRCTVRFERKRKIHSLAREREKTFRRTKQGSSQLKRLAWKKGSHVLNCKITFRALGKALRPFRIIIGSLRHEDSGIYDVLSMGLLPRMLHGVLFFTF